MKVKCCDEQELMFVTVEQVETKWRLKEIENHSGKQRAVVESESYEEDRGVEPEEAKLTCDSCGEEFDIEFRDYVKYFGA